MAAHLRCVVQDYLFTALYLVPSAIALYALAHRRYRPFSRFPRCARELDRDAQPTTTSEAESVGLIDPATDGGNR